MTPERLQARQEELVKEIARRYPDHVWKDATAIETLGVTEYTDEVLGDTNRPKPDRSDLKAAREKLGSIAAFVRSLSPALERI